MQIRHIPSIFILLWCSYAQHATAQFTEVHAGITAPLFIKIQDVGYWYHDVGIYPNTGASIGIRWTDRRPYKRGTSLGVRFSSQSLTYIAKGGRRYFHFETELRIKNTFLDIEYFPLKWRIYKDKLVMRAGLHAQIFTTSRLTGYDIDLDYYFKRNKVNVYNKSWTWYEKQNSFNLGPSIMLTATIIQKPKWSLGFNHNIDLGLGSTFSDARIPIRFSESLGFRFMLSEEKLKAKKGISIERLEDRKARKVERLERRIRRLKQS